MKIQFTLDMNKSEVSKEGDQVHSLLKHALGVDSYKKRGRIYAALQSKEKEVIMICSPERFCKFIIIRNDLGLTNGIKNLHIKILPPEQSSSIIFQCPDED